MPTFKVTDSTSGKTVTLTGDSAPTEQELNDIFGQIGGQDVGTDVGGSSVQSISNDTNTHQGVEKIGVLDQVFVEPSAAGTRELIRQGGVTGKILGAVPGGIGSNLAALGVFGKKNQQIVSKAFAKPSTSETFQTEAIKAKHAEIVERSSDRVGAFSVDKPFGKALLMTELFREGNDASIKGMAQDMWTNPVDWLFAAGDISGVVRSAKGVKDIVKESSAVKKISTLYRKLAKRSTSNIKRAGDVTHDNKKIVIGLEAMSDTADEAGIVVNNTQDAANLVSETKRSVRAEYDNLRKTAQEGGATVDLRLVADDIVNANSSRASSLVNEGIQKKAFDLQNKFYADHFRRGKLSLDEAEDMVRTLNAQRPATLGASIEDVSNAQLNESIAASLRKQLDDVIFNATDKQYKPLKEMYGSLIELDKGFANSVIKAAKESNNSLLKQLSESIDNVPLIYGVLSGNIPLAGASLLQKGGKIAINATKNIDNQTKNLFNTINKIKNPKAFPSKTTISTGRRITPQEDN